MFGKRVLDSECAFLTKASILIFPPATRNGFFPRSHPPAPQTLLFGLWAGIKLILLLPVSTNIIDSFSGETVAWVTLS